MVKNMITSLLKDPKHWIGWVLTSGAIIAAFHFIFGIHLYTRILYMLVLLGTIVIVDIFKHLVKLQ